MIHIEPDFPIRTGDGSRYIIIPKVLQGRSLSEIYQIARDNELGILGLRDVYGIGMAIQPEGTIKRSFIEAKAIDPSINYSDWKTSFHRLRRQLWEDRYHIRPREILMWAQPTIRHVRLVPDELPLNRQSFIIPDYELDDPAGDGDYSIRWKKLVDINWPIENGPLNSVVKGIIGASKIDGRIFTYPEVNDDEGLRLMYLEFRLSKRNEPEIYIYSIDDLKDSHPGKGWLLGKSVE